MDILLEDITLIPEPDVSRIVKKTNIVIEDKIITEISPNANTTEHEYKISGKSLIALPPPINSHSHLPMTLLRGYSDNKPLFPWLQDIWKIENKFELLIVFSFHRLDFSSQHIVGCQNLAEFHKGSHNSNVYIEGSFAAKNAR